MFTAQIKISALCYNIQLLLKLTYTYAIQATAEQTSVNSNCFHMNSILNQKLQFVMDYYTETLREYLIYSHMLWVLLWTASRSTKFIG